jgi:hypothetical protein
MNPAVYGPGITARPVLHVTGCKAAQPPKSIGKMSTAARGRSVAVAMGVAGLIAAAVSGVRRAALLTARALGRTRGMRRALLPVAGRGMRGA